MADNRTPDPRRVTLRGRLSYPTLRHKKATVKGGKEKFSASLLLDPKTDEGRANIKKAQGAVAAAEVEHYGEGKAGFIAKAVEDPKRIALKKGERYKNKEGEVYKGYEGMIAVTTSADKRPLLLAKNKTEVDLEDIEDAFYGGLEVDMIVSFFCVSDVDKGGNGLFATVEAIRSLERGESFGGGARATADDFADEEDDDGIGSAGGGGEDLLGGGSDDDLLSGI